MSKDTGPPNMFERRIGRSIALYAEVEDSQKLKKLKNELSIRDDIISTLQRESNVRVIRCFTDNCHAYCIGNNAGMLSGLLYNCQRMHICFGCGKWACNNCGCDKWEIEGVINCPDCFNEWENTIK